MNLYQKREQRKNNKSEDNKSLQSASINWYPGHMAKSKRELIDELKLIDVIIEIIDSRVPKSTMNPENEELFANKKRILVLNKSDLADAEETIKWVQWYNSKGIICVAVDSISGKGIKEVLQAINNLCQEKNDKLKQKGILQSTIKIGIVGIPNVGKSSFINSFVKKSIAKVGNKPGITRQNQWIRINKDIILLDTPGILWPKFEEEIGLNLCFAGCIKDEIVDIETIAYELIKRLLENDKYREMLFNRYKIDKEFTFSEVIELIDKMAINRGCILKGQNIDYNKISNNILDEFRSGKFGTITLERVGK